MIAMLARDGMRLLIRPRAAVSVALAGVLFGLFVRATQGSAAALAGLDVRGSSLQSLMSGVFLFATCIALVFGVLLGHDDHETGFIAQLAIRPVSRLAYVLGRGLGLAAATIFATLLLVLLAFTVANVGSEGFPELKAIERAQRVVVAGRVLAEGDVGLLDTGEVARFEFPRGHATSLEFTVWPQLKVGGAPADLFSGTVHVVARVMDGDAIAVKAESDARPLSPLGFQFAGPGTDSGVIEIENGTRGASLQIAADQLVSSGGKSNVGIQLALALGLLLAAATIVAMLAFCLSTALSAGPAALTAGFFLLVALARGAVLDLVADAFSNQSSAVRDWFIGAVRVVPDVGRFDLSDRFGRGEALRLAEAAQLSGAAALYIAVALGLAAILLSWRDRR